MGTLSKVLGKKLVSYYKNNEPCRLLVGGLPPRIIDNIANEWDTDIDLFVVRGVENTLTSLPPRVVECKPDDLTAERLQGWIAIINPAELRKVQESISSAGAGTTRPVWEPGYPWRDCDLPGVRWKDVLKEFLVDIGLSLCEEYAIDCINAFMKEIREERDASKRFFNTLDEIGNAISYDDLCITIGLPRHRSGSVISGQPGRETVLSILNSFIKRFREDTVQAVLDELKENIGTKINDVVESRRIKEAIGYFTDSFLSLSPEETENPVLAWRRIFNGARKQWEVLDIELLRDIIGGTRPSKNIEIADFGEDSGLYLFKLGDNNVLVKDRNAVEHLLRIGLNFGADILRKVEEAENSGKRLSLYSSVNKNITEMSGMLELAKEGQYFTVDMVGEGKITLFLYVGDNVGREVASTRYLSFIECCEAYPFITASFHAGVRLKKGKRVKDDDSVFNEYEVTLQLSYEGKVILHGFIYGLKDEIKLRAPGDYEAGIIGRDLGTIERMPSSLCTHFIIERDILEDAELEFEWVNNKNMLNKAIVYFEIAEEKLKAEDSLTEALIQAHAGISNRGERQLVELIKVVNIDDMHGKASFEDLTLKETRKAISIIERMQQDTDDGWWPILLTCHEGLRGQVESLSADEKRVIRKSRFIKLDPQANAWIYAVNTERYLENTPEQIRNYAENRKIILTELGRQFKTSGSSELNIARRSYVPFIDRNLLSEYLNSFSDLLAVLRSNEFDSKWQWFPLAVDSVIIFDENSTAPVSQLLGPYHPITLTRLYYVQECLGNRIAGGVKTPFARVFAESEPLRLGLVLDPQLQPEPAIQFFSGDFHWIWLFRQLRTSKLPEEHLLEWLREAGLDPHTGPLGVDPYMLPSTLSQYLIAYPTHQTIRILLEDCTHASLENLRDSLAEDSGSDGLRNKIPGGIEVHDPIAKIKRDADGELLAYDEDVAIKWYHSDPPDGLVIDISTMPRSERVDLRPEALGGAYSRCMPTVRHGIVRSSEFGLEVSSSLLGEDESNTLEAATVKAIRGLEPESKKLVWGTSLRSDTKARANWVLCSANQVDPRLFIDYVEQNPGIALWTYRIFGEGIRATERFGQGHFLLARISTALENSLQALLASLGIGCTPNELLQEIAGAGLTLGDEFLRTGRKAEGACGQYLIQRLLWYPNNGEVILPHWQVEGEEVKEAGFMIQVDPFSGILSRLRSVIYEEYGDRELASSQQMADLICFNICLYNEELWIHPVVIESKLIRGSGINVAGAMNQARTTASLIDSFLEFCIHDDLSKPHPAFWSQPERMLLTEMMHLGLRLSFGSFKGDISNWHKFEQDVLERVLSGEFKRTDSRPIVIIHHGGATEDELLSNEPHAKIAFLDADNARQHLEVSPAYNSIIENLKGIVRHTNKDEAVHTAREVFVEKFEPEEGVEITEVLGNGYSEERLEEIASGAMKDNRKELLIAAHDRFDRIFSDFIGNEQAVESLRDEVVNGLLKEPHYLSANLLLTGNPSTGKTTVAKKIADILDTAFIGLVGTNVTSESELIKQVDNAMRAHNIVIRKRDAGNQGLPEFEYPPCLVFIDEVHLVKGRAQEGLLTLLEDKDRYVRLKDKICHFPKATFIGATTRPSELDKALRTRFGNPIHLSDYAVPEIMEMLRKKDKTWFSWPDHVLEGLAIMSGRIPREADRLAKKLQLKLKVSREDISIDEALEKLRLEEGLDRNGLGKDHWNILKLLAKEIIPRGKETLVKLIGDVDSKKLTEEAIPYLQRLGLIQQVSRGQIITDKGRNYIRNEKPPEV